MKHSTLAILATYLAAWCSVGALEHAGCDSGAAFTDAWTLLETMSGFSSLAAFNDNKTHPDVLALFDRAINRLETEGK